MRLAWTGASAQLSEDGLYRWRLDRWVGPDGRRGPPIAFVMLNPSTADGLKDDPTIRRCKGFAEAFNYRWLSVVNLYAYRTPYPRDLRAAHLGGADVVGSRNAHHLCEAAREAREVVLAWGGDAGPVLGRSREVSELLVNAGVGDRLRVFGWTDGGEPRHPLFLPKQMVLEGLAR